MTLRRRLRGSTGIGAAAPLGTPADPARRSSPSGEPSSGRRSAGRNAPRRRGAAPVLLIVAVAAILVGAWSAFAFLPSATVTVRETAEELPGLDLLVIADPTASTVDLDAGVIPAERRSLPLSVEDEFPAGGLRVTETRATGSVRWRNCDPGRAYVIPGGSVVSSAAGARFTVDTPVFLPVALLVGSKPDLVCTYRTGPVTAVAAGPDGNVAPGAITVIPPVYNDRLITVTNTLATTGGTRTETPVVRQEDVDAALRSLIAMLDGRLSEAAAGLAASSGDGSGTASVVFPETATRGDSTPVPAPASLVGLEVSSFTLALRASGSVLAALPSDAGRIAEGRLNESVPVGAELLPATVTIEIGSGRVVGGAIRFAVRARAQVVRRIDAEEVRTAVAGLGLAEARTALARYTDATLEVWPDWVDRIPAAGSDRLVVRVVPLGSGTP